jgi:N-carbamoyl-L-amino-acid hydrolase
VARLARFLTLFIAVALPGSAPAGPEALRIDSEQLRHLLSELSHFGSNPEGGVTRVAFTEPDRAAREWLIRIMTDAGLDVRVDAAGNIRGRRTGSVPDLPAILFGSHIDTVPKGGNFDGNVGSMAAMEVMLALDRHELRTRHPLEMIIWASEDSGKGLFGSRAVTRGPDPGELELVDAEGMPLGERMRRLGLDPDRISADRLNAADYAAYLELHIEQGPVLFQSGIDIGVVEGIVAVQHFDVRIEGFANHAGTTPMDKRHDALLAAAQLILAVREEVVAEPGSQVGTVGWVKVLPGAPNVVPGLVQMPIELRALDPLGITDNINRIRARAQDIARRDGVTISIEQYSNSPAVLTDPQLQDLIEQAARDAGFSTLRLPSGAGHDAQIIASYGVPTGMIFVPSEDGVSHSPKERTDWADCARGAEVLYRVIRALDEG